MTLSLPHRPNHCGCHLGKINGHNSTYVKVWRCTFGRITRVLMGKSWGKFVVMPSWGVYLAYQAVKILATADLILYKTALLVTGRCFKLTNSPCIFERRAVTSPTTLESKGRHCHWDYLPQSGWLDVSLAWFVDKTLLDTMLRYEAILLGRLLTIKWATSWETPFMPYANNKSADQPAHPRSLISAFIVRCLDGIISLVSTSEISSL